MRTRMIFLVRTTETEHAGNDEIEETIITRLAAALEPDMHVSTIDRQYYCNSWRCNGHSETHTTEYHETPDLNWHND
jgi:hypothetical protein